MMFVNGYIFWLWQRISALFIFFIFLYLWFLIFFLKYDLALLSGIVFHSASSLYFFVAYLFLVLHAFQGFYVVVTDYIKSRLYRYLISFIASLYLGILSLGLSLWLI